MMYTKDPAFHHSMPIPREKRGLLMRGYTPKTLVFSSLEIESIIKVFSSGTPIELYIYTSVSLCI